VCVCVLAVFSQEVEVYKYPYITEDETEIREDWLEPVTIA
jgi:hypothetical protein